MATSSFKLPLVTLCGLSVVLIFCIFTLAAVVRFPGPFSPIDNWLSDLGTPVMNPAGSVFFDIGCILSGVFLLFLTAGLGAWCAGTGRSKAFLIAGQICGAISAFGLMLVGVFYEGTAYHVTISTTFFLFLLLFITFTAISLWDHPKFLRWIGYYTLVVVLIQLVFIYTYYAYAHAPLWEWLAVFSAQLWVALLAYNALKLD
jgi:hypothetical membrane protein